MDVLKDDEEGWITGRYEEDFEEENATITKSDNQMVLGQPEQYLKGGKDDIKDNAVIKDILPHNIKTTLIEEAQKTTSDSQTSDRKLHEGRSSLLGETIPEDGRSSEEKRSQKTEINIIIMKNITTRKDNLKKPEKNLLCSDTVLTKNVSEDVICSELSQSSPQPRKTYLEPPKSSAKKTHAKGGDTSQKPSRNQNSIPKKENFNLMLDLFEKTSSGGRQIEKQLQQNPIDGIDSKTDQKGAGRNQWESSFGHMSGEDPMEDQIGNHVIREEQVIERNRTNQGRGGEVADRDQFKIYDFD